MNFRTFSHFLRVAVIAVIVGASTTSLRAIELTPADVLGVVIPGEFADSAGETVGLQAFVTFWNDLQLEFPPDGNTYAFFFGTNLPPPPTLPSPAVFGTTITATSLPVELDAPFQYLLASFENASVYFFLGGQTGELTGITSPDPTLLFPPFPDLEYGNLESISLFNPLGNGPRVPENGSTVALLGMAMAIAGVMRRKFVRH